MFTSSVLMTTDSVSMVDPKSSKVPEGAETEIAVTATIVERLEMLISESELFRLTVSALMIDVVMEIPYGQLRVMASMAVQLGAVVIWMAEVVMVASPVQSQPLMVTAGEPLGDESPSKVKSSANIVP